MSVKKQYDEIYGARALYLLLKPFSEQKAFALGLIDDHGNVIRQPKTPEEKESLTMLHRVAFEIKQMIDKLPAGNTKLKQFAVGLHFLNQNQIPYQFHESLEEGQESLKEGYGKKYLEMLHFIIENGLRLVEEELEVTQAIQELSEDGSGVGGIAGGGSGGTPPTNSVDGIEPHDQPVIDKKKKKRLDYDRIFARKPVAS